MLFYIILLQLFVKCFVGLMVRFYYVFYVFMLNAVLFYVFKPIILKVTLEEKIRYRVLSAFQRPSWDHFMDLLLINLFFNSFLTF